MRRSRVSDKVIITLQQQSSSQQQSVVSLNPNKYPPPLFPHAIILHPACTPHVTLTVWQQSETCQCVQYLQYLHLVSQHLLSTQPSTMSAGADSLVLVIPVTALVLLLLSPRTLTLTQLQ